MREKTIRRWSFYNDRQSHLFMVWEEDWYGGEVIYARIVFAFINLYELKQLHARYLQWADKSWWRG